LLQDVAELAAERLDNSDGENSAGGTHQVAAAQSMHAKTNYS
jgi:adhesin HecA-like repeat protein